MSERISFWSVETLAVLWFVSNLLQPPRVETHTMSSLCSWTLVLYIFSVVCSLSDWCELQVSRYERLVKTEIWSYMLKFTSIRWHVIANSLMSQSQSQETGMRWKVLTLTGLVFSNHMGVLLTFQPRELLLQPLDTSWWMHNILTISEINYHEISSWLRLDLQHWIRHGRNGITSSLHQQIVMEWLQ